MIRKALSLIVSFMLMQLNASAQNIVSEFVSTLKDKCVSFGYSYSVSGQVPVIGEGEILLQGDSFRMKGDGLEIYCNGKDRWTVDTAAMECYIESVDGDGMDFESNPALLVGAVDRAFILNNVKSAAFNGKKVSEAVLTPKEDKGNIKEVSLFLSSAHAPAGATILTDNGTAITITIRNFGLGTIKNASTYTLDTEKLDKDFVITDLR